MLLKCEINFLKLDILIFYFLLKLFSTAKSTSIIVILTTNLINLILEHGLFVRNRIVQIKF